MKGSVKVYAALGLAAAGISVAVSACGLAPVDYEGKTCTKDEDCQKALVCDRVTSTCRSVAEEDGGAEVIGAGKDAGTSKDAGGAKDAGASKDAGAADAGKGHDGGVDAGAADAGGSNADAGFDAGGEASQDGGAVADAGGGGDDAGAPFPTTCGTFNQTIGRSLTVKCNGETLDFSMPLQYQVDPLNSVFTFWTTTVDANYSLELDIWAGYWGDNSCPSALTLPLSYDGPYDWYVWDVSSRVALADSYSVDRSEATPPPKPSNSMPSGQLQIEGFRLSDAGAELSISCNPCVLTNAASARCEITGSLHEIVQ